MRYRAYYSLAPGLRGFPIEHDNSGISHWWLRGFPLNYDDWGDFPLTLAFPAILTVPCVCLLQSNCRCWRCPLLLERGTTSTTSMTGKDLQNSTTYPLQTQTHHNLGFFLHTLFLTCFNCFVVKCIISAPLCTTVYCTWIFFMKAYSNLGRGQPCFG